MSAGVQTTQFTGSNIVDDVIGNHNGSTVRLGLDRLVALVGSRIGPTYATLADLNADLDWMAGALAVVWSDPDTANVGLYEKSGASGAGGWARIGEAPISIAMKDAQDNADAAAGSRDAAAVSAGTATTEAQAARAAALAAGAPVFATGAAGLAATLGGDLFWVPEAGVLSLFLNDGGNAVLQASNPITNKRDFDTVQDLLVDATLTYSAGKIGSVAAGTVLTAGGFRYRVAASDALDHHLITPGGVKVHVLPGSDGTVSQLAFGAIDGGLVLSTAACQLAQNAGLAISDKGRLFLVGNLTLKAPVFAGTYKRAPGQTGHWCQAGAEDVFLDCTFDMDDVGNPTDKAVLCQEFEGFRTGANFKILNPVEVGVQVENISVIDLRGEAVNCGAMGFYTRNTTVDVASAYFDVKIDNRARGLLCTNGGIKITGEGGAVLNKLRGHADVLLHEDVGMPEACVGIEVWFRNANTANFPGGSESFAYNVDITGTATGGTGGCTLHGCPEGCARVVARGQSSFQLEITAGSDRAQYLAGSAALAGTTVKPKNAVLIINSPGAQADVEVEDVDQARDTAAASIYVTGSADVRVTGASRQQGGKHYIRVVNSPSFGASGFQGRGSGVERGIAFESGDCDGFRVAGGRFDGVTRCFDANVAVDDGEFQGVKFGNTGAIVGGGGALSNTRMVGCKYVAQPFGTPVVSVDILELDAASVRAGSRIEAVLSASPVDYVDCALGSTVVNKSGASGAIEFKKKAAGTGSGSWEVTL